MLHWLSSSNLVMMLNRAGARVRRSRSWRRRNILGVLPLISLFCALVAGPATSVFAAEYPVNVSNLVVTTDNVVVSQFFLDSAVSFQDDIVDGTNGMLINAYSLVSFHVNASYSDTNGGIVSGYMGFEINHPNVSISTLVNTSKRAEIVSVESGDITNSYIMNTSNQNNTRSNMQIWISRINQRPNFGAWVTVKVYYSFYAPAAQLATAYSTLLASSPNITVSVLSSSIAHQSLESLLPDLQAIRSGLLDSSTGWLPTMNTNLQTMVTNQITANSWLNSIYGQVNVANGHLTNIKSNQVQQISNQNTQIANQQTLINQLQEVLDYLNDTAAADVVDQAKDNFNNNAGVLESGENALEQAADASFDAVDFSKINTISNFSQSVNWWMRCVNYLPSGTGAIWDVIVFGFLIAFVMFILRLVR